MYELTVTYISILVVTGFLAGIINTMAGGGSNLTIPALMVMGLPPDIANATNRVAVLLQSFTGVYGFKSQGKLDIPDIKTIVGTTLVGGLIGAACASYMPPQLLKPVLLSAMIIMAAVILFKPAVVATPEGTQALTVMESKSKSVPLLLLAGFYGGFVQAGVGFILLAAIAGSLRYDLVRANALKMACAAAFTFVALLIFVSRGQVLWVPGLILAAGSMVGAHIAVKLTINISQKELKWFLFIMTICVSAVAILS